MITGHEIRKLLKAQGLTFTDIARMLKVTVPHVWQVAHRKRESARVGQALAVALGKPVIEVFPDQPDYTRPVERIDPKTREKSIKKVSSLLVRSGLSDQEPSNPTPTRSPQ